MSSNSRGLGRGFDALIPTQIIEEEFDPTVKPVASGKAVSSDMIRNVPPNSVKPNPHQPRQNFDEASLQDLAESIRQHGIIQALIVTESAPNEYELIAGERRLRAAKMAGLRTVPVIVRSYTDQQKLELALIENLQRKDLNPIETATSYRKLVDQFNLSAPEIGRQIGKDESTILNTMRLLTLPLEAKRAVANGQITEGHARVVLTVSNPEKQLELAKLIIEHGWTVRQTEEFARVFRVKQATKETGMARIAGTNALTQTLGQYLGTKVNVVYTARGGRLQIEFYSDEELERIFNAIRKQD
ncbi:MAG: ParB/RepB/Spo0J family partition protein [Candidatus Saccharimonadia bacterium]